MSQHIKLTIKDFKKEFKNHVVKIENITITKKIAIIKGENGSGKSTLLKAIANLISFQGEIKPHLTLCYMSENPSYPSNLTVYDFLKSLCLIDKKELSTIDYYLKLFDLAPKKYTQIKYLSKGMLQKLNIIQCLNQNKDLYLLDEPYSGLDKSSINKLNEYINQSKSKFIISTHQSINDKFTNKEIILL